MALGMLRASPMGDAISKMQIDKINSINIIFFTMHISMEKSHLKSQLY